MTLILTQYRAKRDSTVAKNVAPTIRTESKRLLVITPSGIIGRPDVRDIEKLQGFPVDFTKVSNASDIKRRRMLGDSVTVPLVRLIARMLYLINDKKYDTEFPPLKKREYKRDPNKAWHGCLYQYVKISIATNMN